MKDFQNKKENIAESDLNREYLVSEIEFLHNLSMGRRSVDELNPQEIDKVFLCANGLISNLDLIKNDKDFYQYDVEGILPSLISRITTSKNAFYFIQKALSTDREDSFSRNLVSEFVADISVSSPIFTPEEYSRLILKNIGNEKAWPVIVEIYDKTFLQDELAEQMILELDNSQYSIRELGLFIDMLTGLVFRAHFDWKQIDKIFDIVLKIQKMDSISYFLGIKIQKLKKVIQSLSKYGGESGYEEYRENLLNQFYVPEEISDDMSQRLSDHDITSSGFDLTSYRSLVLSSIREGDYYYDMDNRATDWEYLVETCGDELAYVFGADLFEVDETARNLFLEFVKRKNVKDIGKISSFSYKHRAGGFKTFLSLDQDPTLGNRIIGFSIENDQEIVEGVFEKYSEIVDSAHQIESTLVAEINSGKFSDIDTQEMRKHLMSRAKDVLVDFIDAFEMAKDAGIELSTKEIIEKLAKIKADNILLSSALRMMKGRGEQIRLSDIKKLQIDGGLRAEEVSNDDQQEMKRIYAENYTKYPRLSKKLLEGLEVALKSNDSEFTMLRYEDNLTGFYRFDPREDGSVYFASFNIDKEFHGSGLGEAVMLEKIDQVAKEKKIHAECAAYARIGANYIERGFYATEASSAEEVKTLIIERDEMNQNFETKRMTDGEIAESVVRSKMAGQEFFQSEDEKVKIFSAKDNNEFDFGKMIMDGFVLTRYFESAVGGESKWYVALEKA